MLPRLRCSSGVWKSLARMARPMTSQAHQESNVKQADSTKENNVLEVEHKVVIDPLKDEDFFGVADMFTLKDLYNARVHWGHKKGVRNEYMKQYIFGNRLNIDIIDLEMTVPLLQRALNFTAHIAYRGGIIMFITRDRITMPLVERTAKEVGEYSHCRYWYGGTFTNSNVLFGAMTRLPDLCIFMNCQNSVFNQHLAVIEAAKVNIPTVGIVDTGTDPRLICYPVPGNDDSPVAVEFYCKLFKEAIMRGKIKRKEMEGVH